MILIIKLTVNHIHTYMYICIYIKIILYSQYFKILNFLLFVYNFFFKIMGLKINN